MKAPVLRKPKSAIADGLQSVACLPSGECVIAGFYDQYPGPENGSYGLLILDGKPGAWKQTTQKWSAPASSAVSCGRRTCAVVATIVTDCEDQCYEFPDYAFFALKKGGTWNTHDALTGPHVYRHLNDVACTKSDWCTAVGLYDTGVLSETITGDGWSGSRPETSLGQPELDYVACPAEGQCVSAGTYSLGSYWGGTEPMLASLRDGRMKSGVAPFPHNASPQSVDSEHEVFVEGQLNGVACTGVHTCFAVGWYRAHGFVTSGLIEHYTR